MANANGKPRSTHNAWRDRRLRFGYQRLDVFVPPNLWAKLKPKLEKYGGESWPAYALVLWLEDELLR